MERPHRDIFGSIVGLLVFLGGIALLLLTFQLAYGLYNVPPAQALKVSGAKVMDFAATGNSLIGILVKTVLLVIMGFVSSLVSKRGIHLYSNALVRNAPPLPPVE